MTGDDLTRDQIHKIGEALHPLLEYLSRLLARMEQEFPANDPLLARVRAARNAMQDLTMVLHYIGCEGGVGRQRKS